MSSINYNKEYNQFWEERGGEMSYSNPKLVALNIYKKCGGGKILDAGCGMGYLIKEFALLGMDAYGFDVSDNAIETIKKWYNSEKIKQGSMLSIPFPDDYFDIVVSTDVLEHIAEDDIDKALSELRRVTKKYLYVNIATRVDRDFKWHICIHDRQWWENKIITSGFMHSFNRFDIDTFSTIDGNQLEYIGIYEKTSDNIIGIDPLHSVGYENEMKLAQYNLVSKYVTPDHNIVLYNSDNGFSAYLLATCTKAHHVYYMSKQINKIYQKDNIFSYKEIVDKHNTDFIINLDNIEIDINEIVDMLKPGGKYIYYSLNNDLEIIKQYTEIFDIDEIYTFTEDFPRLKTTNYEQLESVANSYIVFVKNPLKKYDFDYKAEVNEKWANIVGYVADLKRDYNNPFIATSIVYRGLRVHSDSLLLNYCDKVLTESSKESADYGAALCVLGYIYLSKIPNNSYYSWIELFEEYYKLNCNKKELSIVRWVCSLSYLNGLINLIIGSRENAIKSFKNCVNTNWLEYSPTLATKIVDSYYLLGQVELSNYNYSASIEYWYNGLKAAEQALSLKWNDTIGYYQDPLPGGIPEFRDILDLAVKCSWGLNGIAFAVQEQQIVWNSSTPSYINELNIFREQWSTLTHHAETQYKQIQEMSAELSKWISSHDNLSNELGRWIDAYNTLDIKFKSKSEEYENIKSVKKYFEDENQKYLDIINDIRIFAREFDSSKVGKLYKLITLIKNPALIGETSRIKTLAKIVYKKLLKKEIAPHVSIDMRIQQIITSKSCIYKPIAEESYDVIMQVDNFIAGGLENVIIDATKIVNTCGLKCGILILGTAGDALKRVQEMGLPYKILPFQENSYRSFLKNANVKFIYAHYSFKGAEIAKNLDIPFIQVIHNTYIWAKTNTKLMSEILDSVKWTSGFFSVSQFVEDYSINTFNIPKEKSVVVPNGINLQQFMQKSKEINNQITKEIRRKHNIPEDAVLYLTVGSIVDQKNYLSLVNAFIKIKDKCPNAYVLFIGKCYDKSILDRIEQLTAEHNIKNRFIYGGLQSNPQAYYHTADIIVHPAFYEGYALTILECLVSNKPVIMSNTGIMAGLDNMRGITLLKPPHDINTLTPDNMTLSNEYIDNLAHYMEEYYNNHPTPDLDSSIINKMDAEYTYKQYYDVANNFISTGKLNIKSGGGISQAWIMLLKKIQ